MAQQRFWLVKSEPRVYSFSDLQNEPNQITSWDGVRSYQARNILRGGMQMGDGVLFYHSNADPPAIVGSAVVVRPGYPDDTAWDPHSQHYDPKSTSKNPIWYMVDIKAERSFPHPVTLPEIKATAVLENMVLLNNARLSVQPVTPQEWRIIVTLGMQVG